MSRPAILFVTYYRLQPTGQMGVFKRCSRLIEVMLHDFDVHLLNFGPLPESDAQFAAIRDRLIIHDVRVELGPSLERILASVHPEAMILGEAPMRGSMRLSHRVASRAGLWQVAIDNVYSRRFADYVTWAWPGVDRWLLLGLLESGHPERLSPRCAAVPPLIRFPEGFGSFERDRISIIGYDPQTLSIGMELMHLLESWSKADVFVSPQTRATAEEQAGGQDGVRVLELPSDAVIIDSLSRARLVFGKAGYGQIVESLQLGAPFIGRVSAGTVTDDIIASYLKPHVRLLRYDFELCSHLPVIQEWLASPPIDTWARGAERASDAISFAAETLKALISDRITAGRQAIEPPVWTRPPDPGFDAVPIVPDSFHQFRWFLENRRWPELRRQLSAATIWVYDRPLPVGELIEMLEGMLADAVDVKLWPTGATEEKTFGSVYQVNQTCCLMWGEHDSWREHELVFDLHIACRDDAAEQLAYLGVTNPTPGLT